MMLIHRRITAAALLICSSANAHNINSPIVTIAAAFVAPSSCANHKKCHHRSLPLHEVSLPFSPTTTSKSSWHQQPNKSATIFSRSSSSTVISAMPPALSSSIISPSNHWGNIAALSFTASLAQLLGKTTMVGKLLGAPVTAMALTFVLSSVGWIPTQLLSSTSAATSSWGWSTLLPPGGSAASAFLQGMSLTLATPLLLLGTSVRGKALKQCGALLGSFVIASLGTLSGATLAFVSPFDIRTALMTALPHGDGIKIAAALLAKNIGGGINYMAVCACLNASTESIAAGLCVDNVMALVYFPLVSLMASKYDDLKDGGDSEGAEADDDATTTEVSEGSSNEKSNGSSPIEALSHAFTIAAVLTALGQFLNTKLHHLPKFLGKSSLSNGSPLNLSLPITTLLAVVFSTYYPSNIFLSPTSSNNNKNGDGKPNHIAKAGETLGTSLLYLFFATAGAPGWRLKDSIQQSFPAIASFLVILYGVHGGVLWGVKKIVDACSKADGKEKGFWKNVVAPQRLLVASSAAIGGPATAAALAKSFEWESLLTPSLLVGNVGYAVATFVGLIFYGVFR